MLKNNNSYHSLRSQNQMSEESKHIEDSPNPKLNMPSSDSTIGGGKNPGRHPPLR